MTSPNTTSSSFTSDAFTRLRAGGSASFGPSANASVGPADSNNFDEKLISVHPVPTSPGISESEPVGPGSGDENVHDDADVQEYMNRLLKRSSATATPPTTAPQTPASPAPAAAPKVEMSAKIWDPKDFVPRSVAPEKKANLSALRELANQSQRSAIETSVRRKLQVKSWRYLALAIAALSFGGLFTFMSAKWLDASMLMGFASFLCSAPLIWQTVRSLRPRSPKARDPK